MTTTSVKRDSVRMSCEMSPELSTLLSTIANNSHLTISDVMRRAVALADIAYQAKLKGQRLGTFDSEGNLVTEYTNIF